MKISMIATIIILPLVEPPMRDVWRRGIMLIGFETSFVEDERGLGVCSSLELLLLIALEQKIIIHITGKNKVLKYGYHQNKD